MHKNNIPLKVALGYCIIAIIMILAISLVYSNTKSIIAINEASREYIKKKDAADSTMTSLLKEEQKNLKQLSDAMAGKSTSNYLQDKVKSLNTGKDSIVVHSKAPQTHEAKKTTVEVMKTRRGFFRRLADAFKKEHAETLSIKQDSNRAIIDSITTPVNVAENVANILDQIDKKEKVATQDHKESINKEMEDLKIVSTKLALRSAKQLSDVHQRERDSMQKAINKAMAARRQLLWQIGLLTLVTLLAIIVMIWFIWRDARKERIYRENLEAANEEIQRIMNQRERLLLTITHDIKAPAASISGFIDLMKEYVTEAQGMECLQNIKNSAAHLSRLVASLLDYHQLENGLMKVQPVSFSPAQLVKESVEGMRLRAKEKGLSISYEMTMGMKKEANQENETDKELFLADAFRIRQILDNLVSNAIKYTDHGSVNIEARVSKIMAKLTLTMSVKDTGKKFGKLMKGVAAQMSALDQDQIAAFEKAGNITLNIDGQEAVVEVADVEIISEDIPGWLVSNEGNLTVALEVELTPELKKEGMARELINRIQNLRKETGLEITDRIKVTVASNEETNAAIEAFGDYIKGQVLADSIEIGDNAGVETEFDDFKLNILVEKN